jgi:drug/metabolite transporter (DMT)-like permease
MVAASALFALMGMCVKLASAHYPAPDLVLYRSLIGALIVTVLVRRRGGTLRTRVPMMHFWRAVLGVTGLGLWFFSLTGLPLGTAMTLNSMSSVWLALFVVAGSLLSTGDGRPSVSAGLVLSVMAGFAGVALVLRPTIDQQQVWFGLAGLMSGMAAALAYLHVAALGRIGEPEDRIVFYFSIGGIVLGGVLVALQGGPAPHTVQGVGLILAVGVLATTAQLLMTRAWAIGHPLVNAALQYLGIAFSVALGVWVFDDPLGAATLLGMALIVCAGITATRVRSRAASLTGPSDT